MLQIWFISVFLEPRSLKRIVLFNTQFVFVLIHWKTNIVISDKSLRGNWNVGALLEKHDATIVPPAYFCTRIALADNAS